MLEKQTDQEYQELKDELGYPKGELLHYETIHKTDDPLGSGICDVLIRHKEISFDFLGEEHETRVKIMAELGCTNNADDLVTELGIIFDAEVKNRPDINDLRRAYFSPDVNQREFRIS